MPFFLGAKILFLHKYSCPAHEVAWDYISGSAWLSPSGICKPSLDESQVPTNAEAVLTSGSGSESKKGSGRLQINAWPIDKDQDSGSLSWSLYQDEEETQE